MKQIITLLFLSMVIGNAVAEIAVKNVKVFSGSPWKEMIVGYTISGTNERKEPLYVFLTVKDNHSGDTYTTAALLDAETTEGRHVVRWDASADGVKLSTDVDVSVIVSVAEYMVVDVSGGASVKKFPIQYLLHEPTGGFTTRMYKRDKIVFRRIPAGSFWMGRTASDDGHLVTLTHSFYIGIFEVTCAQYCRANSSSYVEEELIPKIMTYDSVRGHVNGARWPATDSVDSWSFLGKFRDKTGFKFDLPTEAQWEKACRAGSFYKYPWTENLWRDGDVMDDQYCWHAGNSGMKLHEVGTKKPNAFGLYDVCGNVAEWCLNWYGYPLKEGVDYGVDPMGPEEVTGRLTRGGSYVMDGGVCDAVWRLGWESPSSSSCSGRYGDIGLRLALTIEK